MKIVLFLLLALPLFGKQSERYYQEKFAREIGGQVEVVMKDGTRCDILTATHAIEVDFAKKWAEAIGQSLNYGMQTGKKAGILLILEKPSDQKHLNRTRDIISNLNLDITIYEMRTFEDLSQSSKKEYPFKVTLKAVGNIESIILTEIGQPKVLFEYQEVKRGWSVEHNFSKPFRCFSSSRENLQISVNSEFKFNAKEKGPGDFTWGI